MALDNTILRSDDAALVQEGRSKTLGDVAEGLDGSEVAVEVPLRERVVKKLYKKLADNQEGLRTRELWILGNSERQEWLSKMRAMLQTFDEFVEPIYDATNDWSSTLHLPVTYTAAKTYHARMFAAIMSIDPPFTVKARQAHNVDRAHLIQELMGYALREWANNRKGVEAEVDKWVWRWVTQGSGILKSRWDRRFVRYVDVVEQEKIAGNVMTLDPGGSGEMIAMPVRVKEEVEKEVLQEVFNGPALEAVPIEDVLLVGSGDPQLADDVIHSYYLTASELLSYADQAVFDRDAVERMLASGRNYKDAEVTNAIKLQMAASSGTGQLDKQIDVPRYQILERYARLDVDGSGIASEVVLWVHEHTGELLRATYLHRINKAGLRPFHKIDFHMREGQFYGVGLPELMYSLQREIDAVHNMRMDFGLISSIPFGFYRASSSMKEERMPLEPGVMIPLDNPGQDVFFPNIGGKTGFLSQEEQGLYSFVERMTSISDLSLGVIGGQGAARTATGARALLGESNANLDIYLRRLNQGWTSAIRYLFKQLQDKLPDGFQFRLLGDDGNDFWGTVRSKAEIAGEFDFILEGNSSNSNKAIQIEQANSIVMSIMNPLLLQMGIVSAGNIYEAMKNKLKIEGVKDWARFITKPQGHEVVYTPEQLANAILAGIPVRLTPQQDLQGFIDFFNEIVAKDELLGQFSTEQTVKLAQAAQEAQGMIEAMAAQQAQQANAQQMAMNASGGGAPSMAGAGMAQGAGMVNDGQ
jgi:hypothetical protein